MVEVMHQEQKYMMGVHKVAILIIEANTIGISVSNKTDREFF